MIIICYLNHFFFFFFTYIDRIATIKKDDIVRVCASEEVLRIIQKGCGTFNEDLLQVKENEFDNLFLVTINKFENHF